MYLSQDWLMRQIQLAAAAAAQLLFRKSGIAYRIEDETDLSQTDLLHKRLKDLMRQGELCRAEDLLYERLEFDNRAHLALALDFYQSLNELSDDVLEACGFPRSEIEGGIHDVLRRFGIVLPGL